MAGELGLAAVLPQRGWEALKAINWSVQKPPPRHPAGATPEEREGFKKSWPRWSRRKRESTRTNRLNTAKLNDLDPHTYLADVLERMISGRTPVNRLDELLAWNWKAARDALAPAA